MNYKIVISDRAQWENSAYPLRGNAQKWFADGSKTSEGTGVGVFGPSFKRFTPLGTEASVMQAEILGILLSANEASNRGLKGIRIHIHTDSKAAIFALNKFEYTSKLTYECQKTLNKLASENYVSLIWVPGHSEVKGNVIADSLAKRGSANQLIGPQPCFGFNNQHVKMELTKWENKEVIKYKNKVQGQRQAKNFIVNSKTKANEALSLKRKDLRLTIGILSGHGPLRYHLKNIGRSTTSNCRFCDGQKEDSHHILLECPALSVYRGQHLGERQPSIRCIQRACIKDILGFIKEINID